MKTQNK